MFCWGIIFLIMTLITSALGLGGLVGYGRLGSENCIRVGIILFLMAYLPAVAAVGSEVLKLLLWSSGQSC